MQAVEREFSLANGLVLRADCFGAESENVALLAHGGGQTRHSWRKTGELLAAQGWYVVAYDQRGHGQSDWSDDGVYKLDFYAQDQLELAAQLPAKPVVVGASLGGLAALLANGLFSREAYRAVVLVDITPQMDQQGAFKVIEFMQANMAEGFADLEQAAEAIAVYTGRKKRIGSKGLEKNLRLCEDGNYRWHWDPKFLDLTQDRTASPQRLIDASLAIDEPMLLVRGHESDVVTEAVADEFLSLKPDCHYVNVKDAKHMVAGDKNDIFAAEVIQFLKSL